MDRRSLSPSNAARQGPPSWIRNLPGAGEQSSEIDRARSGVAGAMGRSGVSQIRRGSPLPVGAIATGQTRSPPRDSPVSHLAGTVLPDYAASAEEKGVGLPVRSRAQAEVRAGFAPEALPGHFATPPSAGASSPARGFMGSSSPIPGKGVPRHGGGYGPFPTEASEKLQKASGSAMSPSSSPVRGRGAPRDARRPVTTTDDLLQLSAMRGSPERSGTPSRGRKPTRGRNPPRSHSLQTGRGVSRNEASASSTPTDRHAQLFSLLDEVKQLAAKSQLTPGPDSTGAGAAGRDSRRTVPDSFLGTTSPARTTGPRLPPSRGPGPEARGLPLTSEAPHTPSVGTPLRGFVPLSPDRQAATVSPAPFQASPSTSAPYEFDQTASIPSSPASPGNRGSPKARTLDDAMPFPSSAGFTKPVAHGPGYLVQRTVNPVEAEEKAKEPLLTFEGSQAATAVDRREFPGGQRPGTMLGWSAGRPDGQGLPGNDAGRAEAATVLESDTPRSVRSTATGYGAGERMPRPVGVTGMALKEKETAIVTFGAPRRKARPSSAPLATAGPPPPINLAGVPPEQILYRLFIQYRFRIPYQYFYERLSFKVVTQLDLSVWRENVDDTLLAVLGACTGHTQVATRLDLDGCTGASDSGFCVLLPRLPALRELTMRGCRLASDQVVFSLTTKVPVDGTDNGALVAEVQEADIGAPVLSPSTVARPARTDSPARRVASARGAAPTGSQSVATVHRATSEVTQSRRVVTGADGRLLVADTTDHTLRESLTRIYAVVPGTGSPSRLNASAADSTRRVGRRPRQLELPCQLLKSVTLRDCPNITDSSLHAMCRSLTSITSLDVSGTSITDTGLRELLLKCRHLRRLHVADTGITDGAFDQLLLMAKLVPVNPLKHRKDVLNARGPSRARPGGASALVPAGAGGTRPDPLAGNEDRFLILDDVNFSGCIGLTSPGLQTFLKVCPHLKRLDLSNGPSVDDETLEALWNRGTFWGQTRSVGTGSLSWLSLAGCTKVTHMGLSWLTIQNVDIEYLDLSGCDTYGLECMRSLNCLRALKDLRLVGNSSWHPESLRWLFVGADPSTTDTDPQPSNITTLTRLDLTGCRQFATEEGFSLLSRQPHLRELVFPRIPFDVEGVRTLVDSIESIEELDLHQSDGITEQGVIYLLTMLPRLRKIDITGSRGITDRVLIRLRTQLSPSVRELHIGGLPPSTDSPTAVGSGKVTDHALAKFSNTKCKLEILDLRNHPKVTSTGVGTLTGHITSLHTLDLTGCPDVSPRALTELADDRRPNFPFIEACTSRSTDGFQGMRLVVDLDSVSIREGLRMDIAKQHESVTLIARFVRNIWQRRSRWKRNAKAAHTKRTAARLLQRVALGFLARREARRLKFVRAKLARALSQEWHALLERRREALAWRVRAKFFKRRAWRNFVEGAKAWMATRRPPPTPGQIREAVLMHVISEERRVFEGLKRAVRWRREQWERIVKWHAQIVVPRSLHKLSRLTKEAIRRRKRLANEVFMNVADRHCFNAEWRQEPLERARLHIAIRAMRAPFDAWRFTFHELQAREMRRWRRRVIRPKAKNILQSWSKWAQKKRLLRTRLNAVLAAVPKRVNKQTFQVIKDEALKNADERVKREEEEKRQKELQEQLEAEKRRRIEVFTFELPRRRAIKAWKEALHIWQKKKARWRYAGLYYQRLKKARAFRMVVKGFQATKARRLHKEATLRKAMQWWVDQELSRTHRLMRRWRDYTADAIERRERNRRLLRQAVLRMMQRTQSQSFQSWVEFVARRKRVIQLVVKMQTLWRRRGPMKYLRWLLDLKAKEPLAAITLQRWVRGRRSRNLINKWMRLKRLLEYKRREYDWIKMTAEDRLGEGMRDVWRKAIFVQRFWRNRVKLRALIRELRKHEIRERDANDMKAKEWYRWEIDSKLIAEVKSKKFDSAVLVIQAIGRRFLERCRWTVHKEAKKRYIGAVMWQKHWRGEMGRRLAAARRRTKWTNDRVRKRRARAGAILRTFGFAHRYQQEAVCEELEPYGLSPHTFTMGLWMKDEITEDRQLYFDELKHYSHLFFWEGGNRVKRNRVHAKWFRDTNLKLLPVHGNAVRIVNTKQAYAGYSGRIVQLQLSYGKPRASIKLDHNQEVTHVPLITAPAPDQRSELTLKVIPNRRFKGAPSKLSDKWRDELREWAARERLERRRTIAALTCQRAVRNYLAPIFMARQKIREDTIINTRRRRIGRVLKFARLNNKSTGDWLVSLGVVRRVDIPLDLSRGPILRAWNNLKDRRKRAWKRVETVMREVRRRREFVSKMERLEWAKMTRWQRRMNWHMAPAVRARHGITEHARVFASKRLEEMRILAKLDRSMMLQGDRELRSRTRRVVARTVRGGQKYGPLKDLGVRQPVLREYNFRVLRYSRHVDGFAAEQREQLKQKKARLDKLKQEEEAGSLTLIRNAGIGGFKRYLSKLQAALPKALSADDARKMKADAEAQEALEAKGTRKKTGAKRGGGRGFCDLYGTWDGSKPHGTGKAKFMMILNYDPSLDPNAGDMYDELLCNFEYGDIIGHVTIRYHDGSVYEGPYVADGEDRLPDHWGKRISPLGVLLEGACIDNHTVPRELTGNALVILPSGESYLGDWVNGKRHGKGVAILPDGTRYQGEWVTDMFHGWGRKWTPAGLAMDGRWRFGIQEGHAEQRFPQRGGGFTQFKGEVVGGAWTGQGRCEYHDGGIYEGELRGGRRYGYGMLIEADGSKYTGPFVDHMKEGFGTEKLADGTTYEGPFALDRRHGIGLVTSLADPPDRSKESVWEEPSDELWMRDWTADKPEMRGIRVKKTAKETEVVKKRGWQHLNAVDGKKSTSAFDEEAEARRIRLKREAAEREAARIERVQARRARREKRRKRRERAQRRADMKAKRRAEKPDYEDTTTSDSGDSVSSFSPWTSEEDEDSRTAVAEEKARLEKEAREEHERAMEIAHAEGDVAAMESLASFQFADSSVEDPTEEDSALVPSTSKSFFPELSGLQAELSATQKITVRRRGRWLYGELLEWISNLPTEHLTREFVRRFFHDGIEFDSMYATLIARRLPEVPDGVDVRDVWVQRALREIIFRAGGTLGIDTLRRQEKALKEIEPVVERAQKETQRLWEAVLQAEEHVREKAELAAEAQKEFADAMGEFRTSYTKVVSYWHEEAAGAGERYRKAIADLKSLIPLDWKLFIEAFEPGGIAAKSRAVRLMLDALNDLFKRPTDFLNARMLVQSAAMNSEMGDKDAVYHSYSVLCLHRATTLDPFQLCDSDVPERIQRYMSQPDFRIDCADYHAISDAPAVMVQYLLAAQRFIFAARKIEDERSNVHRLRAFMKSKQSLLQLQQEELSELRRKVISAQEEHKVAVRDLELVEDRKASMVQALEETKHLIRTGEMPQPKEEILEFAQGTSLAIFDNRRGQRDQIL